MRKIPIFRDLPQSPDRPCPVNDAAHQRPIDELHHEVATRQNFVLADVPDEIGAFDCRRPLERRIPFLDRIPGLVRRIDKSDADGVGPRRALTRRRSVAGREGDV